MTASEFRFNDDRKVIPFAPLEPVTAPPPEAQSTAQQPTRWIINPVADFFFCYGGIVWILMAMTVLIDLNSTWAFETKEARVRFGVLIAFFFSNTHVVATLFRLYGEPEFKTTMPKFRIWLPSIIGLLIVACFFIPSSPGYLVKINLCWNSLHWSAQAYGIAMIYLYKRNYKVGDWGRRIVWWVIISAPIMYTLRYLCDPHSFDEKSIWTMPNDPTLPFVLPEILQPVSESICFAIFCCFIGLVVYKWIKDKQLFPMEAFLVLSTAFFTWITTGHYNMVMWLFAQPLFHGAQYLALCATVRTKQQCRQEGRPFSDSNSLLLKKPSLKYYAWLFLIAGFLSYALPEMVHRATGCDVLFASAIFTFCLSFQHFIIDMRIWRLRDPKVRELVLY